MMRGQDFLELAVRLANGASEAEYRTAVSRAYYGAFHAARDLVEDTGVELPATAEAHRKVQLCLAESGDAIGKHAGDELGVLRNRRNSADYDLHSPGPGEKNFAVAQIARAQRLVAAIASCRTAPAWPQFRAKVRTYAAQVLRLPVSS
jgi:uncharacterized protein (UPF0332 family)